MLETVCRAGPERLDAAVARLRHALAAENVLLAGRRFLEFCKAYDPNQPRVPAGSSEGGQWTSGERQSTGASRRTPIRLAASDKPSLRRAGRIGLVLEAARQLIDAFRNENQLRDLFGEDVGTVAVTSLDEKYVYGFNSGISEYSGQYTLGDEAAADELRERMLGKYPEVLNTSNIGLRPNNALYHAETTVLLRAARENGGTLRDKNLVVVVDRPLCPDCSKLLPYVGLELGNPTITFVGPKGSTRAMRDGVWLRGMANEKECLF